MTNQDKWTKQQIPDLTGKVIIVTGGNSGLGYESVKAFAEKGAEVILASRSVEKGEAAKAEIEKENPAGKIVVMPLDLTDLSKIRGFADSFLKTYQRLDVLLNNAGIMMTPYFLTGDGFEGQFGTNHLGHFALTGLLMDLIVKTPGSRVVNVSSSAHNMGTMDFDNLQFEEGKGYGPAKAYGRSKLSNLLFTYELQRFFEANGIDSLAVAAHPGFANTSLTKYLEKRRLVKMFMPLAFAFSQSAAMGALPQIRAAVDPGVRGSQYFGPEKGGKGYPVLVQSNKASHIREDARRLWEISEKLTGVTITFQSDK
jgi:NAD(P)-dependent dehydrogenase (short-subunit alcohol dehydrogenase family)